MKKFIPILIFFILVLTATFYLSKGSINEFKDFLVEENIEYKEVSININSTFDKRLLGEKPHHLQITSDVFLHIYKYPSNAIAQKAKENFIRKTEMLDMTGHNLYVADEMFIILDYDGKMNDVSRSIGLKIEELE
ncbi:ATP:corrinoid adenosyltransferase [Bacillus tianshenii]|uniref:ATP:corrinoid adenosyltransferase n=1 Tax=Sutcliffiella tianshenii TaxID=1463404 RepID=A0ABS2NXK2_9BACI|nr:hypothetical protein [Bacillus tianshenii]MBM7619354.1 ATP:corrinoid adenosyltransferase [Bacillus tianshenii]